jgi:hypothetical protein
MKLSWLALAVALGVGAFGCASRAAPPRVSTTRVTTATPIDATRVGSLVGGRPETDGGVVKVTFPRDDVPVDVAGFAKIPPFMGLASWVAFQSGDKPNVEAMVMGDLVLFEDEVNPTMSDALEHGLEVTALHNHFFFDKPRVYFMHVGGEGGAEHLARAVRATLDAQRAVRQKTPKPAESFGGPAVPTPSRIDGDKLDAVFNAKGTSRDGMYKVVIGRKARASCGCAIGKTMGVNTWAAFAGSNEHAVVDGDFAVTEGELQTVLKALRTGGVQILAIHSHMTGESPRILFLHYWGVGPAATLATTIKAAIDLTNADRS